MDCIKHKQKGDSAGYANTRRIIGGIRRTCKMHRAVYCEHTGTSLDSIDGLVVRHKCDNPRCINPHHLELGSHMDNMMDRAKRGRTAKGGSMPHAKITQTDADAIRRRYVPGCKFNGQAKIACDYGISQTTVSQIVNGFKWVG